METIKVTCSKCNSQGFWPAGNTAYRCWNCEILTNIGTTTKPLLPPAPPGRGLWLNFKAQVFRGLPPEMVQANNRSSLSMSTYDTSLNTKLPPALGLARKRPNKRALLVAVTYAKRKYKLKGTINDVKNMKDLLISQYGYPPHCIRVLTEFEPEREFQPTKKNIERSLKWLVEGCQAGDSLVFYFSGHGSQQPDFKDDELDGFDETICPVDFMEEGAIIDNDINSTIVRPLKKGVTLHAIVDACHCGTILDLVYLYDQKRKLWKDNSPPSGARKSTIGGLAFSLSSCEDDQMATDTTAISRKDLNGLMTYLLIEIVKKFPGITYGQLLENLSEAIRSSTAPISSQDGCGLISSRMLAEVWRQKIVQMPLLSASEKFDVHAKRFVL